MAKYFYKVDNSVMINTAIRIWSEEVPAVKYLLIVPLFKKFNHCCPISVTRDEDKLISMIKSKFELDEVEVEEYTE